MKIPAIKRMVELYSLEELKAAELALSQEEKPAIAIEGEDEGEQLTHAFAAMWIKEKIAQGVEFNQALRDYTQMVRGSIS
jgi:hypothetical protein